MVGRLVDQQPARAVLVAVPAAEIVGAVDAVEIPAEIDGGDLADGAGHEDVLHLGAVRRVAVVEADGDRLAGLLLGVKHVAQPADVDRHRLLGDDVAAKLRRAGDIAVVEIVRHGDHHHVGPLLLQHAVEIVGAIGGDRPAGDLSGLAGGKLQSVRIGVAQADQLVRTGKGGNDGVAKHQVTRAGSNDGVFQGDGLRKGSGVPGAAGGRRLAAADDLLPGIEQVIDGVGESQVDGLSGPDIGLTLDLDRDRLAGRQADIDEGLATEMFGDLHLAGQHGRVRGGTA